MDEDKVKKIIEEISNSNSSRKKDAVLKELMEISNNFVNLLYLGQK